MPKGSVINLTVGRVQVNYASVFSAPAYCRVSGTGFVVDAMDVIAAPITWGGETEPKQFTREEREVWAQKLRDLGVPETAEGKFLVIVTNAHVMHAHKTVSFSIANDSLLFSGVKPLVLFQEIDLALLIPSAEVLPNLVPLAISTQCLNQNENLAILGFPKNGKQLSYTQGHFKRVLYIASAHSSMKMVVYETDSPANSGDSGAPVLDGKGSVVAVHFQHVTQANGQSHHVPIQYLIAFLRNFVSFGRNLGMLSMPIFFNQLQNEAERMYYGLDKTSRVGVLVSIRGIHHLPDIYPGDVLLSVNGFQIDGTGNIDLYGDGKISIPFTAYLSFLPPFENVSFKLLRNKEEKVIEVPLTTPVRTMFTVSSLPPTDYLPTFYRCGIAFIEPSSANHEANKDYKSLLGSSLAYMSANRKGLVCGRFMSEKAEGYPDGLFIVARINDIEIRDLFHAYEVMKSLALKRSESEPTTQIFCVYSRLDVSTPTFIMPVLTPEEEVRHRELFNVDARFVDLPSPATRNPMIKKFWDEVRGEAHRVSLPVRQRRFDAQCVVTRAVLTATEISAAETEVIVSSSVTPVVR